MYMMKIMREYKLGHIEMVSVVFWPSTTANGNLVVPSYIDRLSDSFNIEKNKNQNNKKKKIKKL